MGGPRYLLAMASVFKRELRALLAVSAVLLFAVNIILVVTIVSRFTHPADSTAVARYLNDEYTYYCNYWALRHTKADDPAPVNCGVQLASIKVVPIIYNGPIDDEYAYGNCTYWAAERRAQTGRPVPNTWGDAVNWAASAAADGYVVDNHPVQGAIMQTPAGGLGHVAFVEGVDPDGTWHISEMNVVGFDEVDYRALSASAAAGFAFIH